MNNREKKKVYDRPDKLSSWVNGGEHCMETYRPGNHNLFVRRVFLSLGMFI